VVDLRNEPIAVKLAAGGVAWAGAKFGFGLDATTSAAIAAGVLAVGDVVVRQLVAGPKTRARLEAAAEDHLAGGGGAGPYPPVPRG
jgi:hypothetical protein